jgi:hypothetical protein
MEKVDTKVVRRKLSKTLRGFCTVRLLTALSATQASHGIDTILTLLRYYDNETRAERIMEESLVADNPMKAPPIH